MKSKKTFYLILTLIIPVAGYALMHGSAYILPISQNNIWANILFFVVIMGLGLTVPYLMLKSGLHRAHLNDPREKELVLKDIGKDKDQLDQTTQEDQK